MNGKIVQFKWDDGYWKPGRATLYLQQDQGLYNADFETNGEAYDLKETNTRGVFTTTVELHHGMYQYIFRLDNDTWTHNPNQPHVNLPSGKKVNYIEIVEDVVKSQPLTARFTPNMFVEDSEVLPLLGTNDDDSQTTEVSDESESDDEHVGLQGQRVFVTMFLFSKKKRDDGECDIY
eukprot:CFRG0525T1